MREACGGQTVRLGAQHRSVSVARSTPTLHTYAQRNVGKGTPKKIKNPFILLIIRRYYQIIKTIILQ
ncbi:MAG: hypothetical protein NZ455_12485 [Bacteroidia bacterium]|nr:hypothetical protein [Bacteroidia bacterium]MDW8345892.1 hypothetical protein [Bacteroidia bacterium]